MAACPIKMSGIVCVWCALHLLRSQSFLPSCPPLLTTKPRATTTTTQVLQGNGNYLHVQYRMPNGRFGAVKIHRNTVFVIERLNFMDGLWNLAMKPSDIVLSTKAGHKATKIAQPYVNYVGELAKPAIFSGRLAVGAVKTSINATLSGATAAGGAIVGKSHSPAKL